MPQPVQVPAEPCEGCGQTPGEKRMIVGTKTDQGWPVYIMWLCDGCFEMEKRGRKPPPGVSCGDS